MRLINCHTLKLEEFFGVQIPPYYILSHRWTDDEITYQDFKKGRRKESKGYQKVVDCCRCVLYRHQAGRVHFRDKLSNRLIQHDEFSGTSSDRLTDWRIQGVLPEACYIWIDTCCIDKRSSAELSESINSMYQYYANAFRCYAFLSDVVADSRSAFASFSRFTRETQSQMPASQWFTRGWTLQELLAPRSVVFLDNQWQVLGDKCNSPTMCGHMQSTHNKLDLGPILNEQLARITGIETQYLLEPSWIHSASIACRMSWASRRTTSRIEDTAYCLLGLLRVSMPLLYGEGETAFLRLQEELIKRSTDQSIFAWTLEPTESPKVSGILARSPRAFARSGKIASPSAGTWPYTITNTGLELRTLIRRATWRRQAMLPGHHMRQEIFMVRLNCTEPSAIQPSATDDVVYEDDDDAQDRTVFISSEIALTEIPRPVLNGTSQPVAPLTLYQRIHGLEGMIAHSDIANTPEDVGVYVRTFDEVKDVPDARVDSLLHVSGLFRDDA